MPENRGERRTPRCFPAFSGGFDLAASRLGWENLFHCEIDEFCTRILNYYFPNAEHYADIRKTDFTKWRGRIDVLSGGFPCQPFSLAGKRKGTCDDRYLWPDMLRAIQEIRPTWVVGENVAGILTMVQSGKEVAMGSQANIFGEVDRKRILLRQEYVAETICGDLEREGYSVQPFIIPACAVGAPHRRDRVWIIAHRSDAGVETVQCGREDGVYATGLAADTDINRQRERTHQQVTVSGCQGTSYDCACGEDGVIVNTTSQQGEQPKLKLADIGSTQQRESGGGDRTVAYAQDGELPADHWCDFPSQSPVCRRDDELSGRLDGITFSRWRQESVKAYGNAVVPAVVEEIFRAIEKSRTATMEPPRDKYMKTTDLVSMELRTGS